MTGTVPVVSVILRSMARPTLDAALASIAAQDYPALEVIVVAASGPAHPPVPETCGTHPLRFVASASPLARPAAANAGLDHAGGEWIIFLDDDDVFLPGHISALMAARAQAPQARLIHSYAVGKFDDGSIQLFGQPHSRIQLFERNYIHLSSAVFARELVSEGCRFDETLAIHEDWDFFLQLAQRTPFHFVPLKSFEWHVEAGNSGAAGGGNSDSPRFMAFRNRVYEKWAATQEALVERVAPHLQQAGTLAQNGQWQEAEAECRAALAESPNDPWTLNTLAMVKQGAKDLDGARAVQQLAVAVRPLDAGFVFNLALICSKQGDIQYAQRCCARALGLNPDFEPAKRLQARLAAAAPSWDTRVKPYK